MVMLVMLFIVTTIGSLISGLTGLAGGAVILGGLSIFFPADKALALHGIVQGVSNGTRITLWWRSVHWGIVWRYSILLLPGAWIGGLLFAHMNLALMEAVLGAVILLVVWCPTPKQSRFQFTPNGFILLGLVSGFFSMLAGVVGPLLNPFFDKLGIKREQMVSTKSACQLVLHLARVASYFGAAQLELNGLGVEITVMIFASIGGILLSRPLGKHISDRQLDIILKVLLTLIGVKNVLTGLRIYWGYV